MQTRKTLEAPRSGEVPKDRMALMSDLLDDMASIDAIRKTEDFFASVALYVHATVLQSLS